MTKRSLEKMHTEIYIQRELKGGNKMLSISVSKPAWTSTNLNQQNVALVLDRYAFVRTYGAIYDRVYITSVKDNPGLVRLIYLAYDKKAKEHVRHMDQVQKREILEIRYYNN